MMKAIFPFTNQDKRALLAAFEAELKYVQARAKSKKQKEKVAEKA